LIFLRFLAAAHTPRNVTTKCLLKFLYRGLSIAAQCIMIVVSARICLRSYCDDCCRCSVGGRNAGNSNVLRSVNFCFLVVAF